MVEAGFRDNPSYGTALINTPEIRNRILELQQEIKERTIVPIIVTRQYLIESLVDNLEKALGRRPVRMHSKDNWVYTYRAEAANRSIQMLGSEIGMFADRQDITIRNDLDGMSDIELVKTLVKEGQYLLEHEAKGAETDGNDNPDPESVDDG